MVQARGLGFKYPTSPPRTLFFAPCDPRKHQQVELKLPRQLDRLPLQRPRVRIRFLESEGREERGLRGHRNLSGLERLQYREWRAFLALPASRNLDVGFVLESRQPTFRHVLYGSART